MKYLGDDVSDDLHCFVLLESLPRAYESFAIALKNIIVEITIEHLSARMDSTKRGTPTKIQSW